MLTACWLTGAACAGVEADVLSLRPVADFAVADAAAPGLGDGATTACKTQTLSIKECLDIPAWTPMVQMVCASLGLVPGRLALTAACPMGTAQSVRFECCLPPVCTDRYLGDPLSCRDAAELVDSATLDCKLSGQTLSVTSLFELCGTRRYRMVKYLCCAPSPPLPGTMP